MIREYIIKISDEIIEEEIADRPQELVRCKDCKHGTSLSDGVWCKKYIPARYPSPDWFCADGKRRTDDA